MTIFDSDGKLESIRQVNRTVTGPVRMGQPLCDSRGRLTLMDGACEVYFTFDTARSLHQIVNAVLGAR